MSVAEFSALLQNQAYKSWFKASNTNVLNKTVTELREYEESSAKTDFIISENTVADVIKHLTSETATPDQITKVLEKLKAARPKKLIEIHEKTGIDDIVTLKFARINLTQIGNLVNKAFEDEIKSSGNRISDFFERGHVTGVATNLVKQTQFGIRSSKLDSKQKSLLLGILDDYIKTLEADDVATSNLKDPEHKLYAKYTKNYRRYLVELQPKALNQASGRAVVPITSSLRKFFKPENYVYLSDKQLAKSEDNFFVKLITSKGSPSVVDLILEDLSQIISGKSSSRKEYKSPLVEVYSKKIKLATTKANADIKKTIAELKKVKQKLSSAKTTPIRNLQGQFYSLASLQVLINTHLQDVVSANMGDEGYPGGQRKTLNYRTGRFAASAKVERLTVSREGYISAFYSYMKKPYQTFEPGFAQGKPASRDPKLLISKSIREIAAIKVGNRLRAVSI